MNHAGLPTFMLRIGIDLCGTDSGRSGMSTHARAMLGQFAALFPDREYHLFGSEEDREAYFQGHVDGHERFHWHGIEPKFAAPSPNLWWHFRRLPKLIRDLRLDVFYVPAGNRRGVSASRTPVVVTVHDLWNKHFRGKFGLARQLYLDWILPRLIRKAARHVAVSEFTRDDMVRFFGLETDAIVVAPNGVDHARFHVPEKQEAARKLVGQEIPGLDGPWIAFVARIEHPAKNHVDLIEAFDLLKERDRIPHALVCPGKPWPGSEPVFERVERSPFRDSISFPGFLSTEGVAALFQTCDVAVFPSRFEGFGLPVLEAMACGAPMVVSDIPVLREVGGDAVLRFTPGKPAELAEQIAKLLADPELRRRYRDLGLARAAEFTWERAARLTMQAIEDAAREASSTC